MLLKSKILIKLDHFETFLDDDHLKTMINLFVRDLFFFYLEK